MPHILILADDLTGAADTGAQFARRGWRTLLALQPGAIAEADVLVLSSDSRDLPDAPSAARAVQAALAGVAHANFLLVYKKIDSTLRGYPAAELAALLAELGDSRALIAPAFPAQGRTTRGGSVFVQGVPLDRTAFGSGPRSGDLRRRFGANPPPGLLSLEGVRGGVATMRNVMERYPGVWIADAETDADLRHIVQAGLALGLRVLCGSAGLAAALAGVLDDNPSPSPDTLLPQSTPGEPRGPLLAVAGSRHPTSAAQVAAACQAGASLVRPGAEFYFNPGEMGVAETAARVAQALARDGVVILATDPAAALRGPKNNGALLAHKLGLAAARALEKITPAGLFLTGGDTAHAVCRELGCTRLWLGGEVEPGIPWARLGDGRFPGLPVVTKAGGFGHPGSILQAIHFLHGRNIQD